MDKQHNNFFVVTRKGSVAYGVYTPSRQGARWGKTARAVIVVAVDEAAGRLGNQTSRSIVRKLTITDWVANPASLIAAKDRAAGVAATWAAA